MLGQVPIRAGTAPPSHPTCVLGDARDCDRRCYYDREAGYSAEIGYDGTTWDCDWVWWYDLVLRLGMVVRQVHGENMREKRRKSIMNKDVSLPPTTTLPDVRYWHSLGTYRSPCIPTRLLGDARYCHSIVCVRAS
eukprot:1328746-Rhodomonas_salina.4